MKFRYMRLSLASLLLGVGIAQASDWCENGTVVRVNGQVDNNAVTLERPGNTGQYTLGVVRWKLVDPDNSVIRMHCALIGEPTDYPYDPVDSPDNYLGNGIYSYDHRLSCDDDRLSVLALRTGFLNEGSPDDYNNGWINYDDGEIRGGPFLRPGEINRLCNRDDAVPYVWFVERSDVNAEPASPSKGMFTEAGGSLYVRGCVNVQDFQYPIVNMHVEGSLCLPAWPL